MVGAPSSNGDPEAVTHRRRRSTVWKRTPTVVKIAVGVCLVLFALSFYLIQRSHVKKIAAPPTFNISKLMAAVPKADLVLSQSSLNLETHAIEGVVTNVSAKAYTNIEVTFFVLGSDGTSSELRSISVASLAPHGSAKFSTSRVANDARQWSVKEIRGTAAADPAVAGQSLPPASTH